MSPLGSRTKHEVLTSFQGGLGHELALYSAVLRQGSLVGEGRQEVEVSQVALKRPAFDHHVLAADDTRPRDPQRY